MTPALAAQLKEAAFASRWYAWRLASDVFPGVAVLCYHGVRDDDWPSGTMVNDTVFRLSLRRMK